MGMQPSILPDMKDGKISEIVMFPYAAIKYNGYGTSVPLIVQQSELMLRHNSANRLKI
jgi:hypothetical protein